jgi:type I restriction enzyme S subunit
LVGHRTENRDSAPSRAQRLAKKNDVFYQTVRPYQKNNYLFDLPYDNYVFSTGYAQMRPIGNGYFLLTLVQEAKFVNRVLERSTGTSYPAINSNELAKLPVKVPADIEEEQQVGTFFKSLDNTIALHQRKLDALKQIKKGFLQQMFPENREKVPRVRFTDFDENWEQRKLEEVSTHRGGTAIEKYFNENGKYKVISIGSYGTDSKYVDQGIRAISNEITDTRVVHEGELTMVLNDKTSNGTIIGRSLLIDSEEEYVINQRTEIVSPNADFNVNFAYITLNNAFREKVKKIVQGGTQIYVNYPAVKSLTLDFPSYEEQTKIGTFFKQLDGTIVLHQQKLEQLKTLKNAYLQNMFI